MNRREPEAAGQDHRADAGADVKTPAALCDLGHQHLKAGRILDAQMCCEQALAADGNCADAMHLMGLLSLQADQSDHAVEWFARAVRHDEKPAYLLSLGNTFKHQRRLDDAFRTLDRAVEIDIDSPLAWKALAQLLADLNRREEAALAFQHVLKLDPDDADAAHRAGLLLLLAGKREEALGFFDRSDRLRPDHAPTQHMRRLASALNDRALFEKTLSEMDRAPAVDPDTAYIHNDVGDIYRRSGRHEEALIWFEKALALRPDLTLARSNKAYSLARLHRFDEALADYAALKAVDPAGAEWNQALLQLLLGNFEAGWIGREARWKVPGLQLARYVFSQPMWLGKEPIAGKTILIYQEEGLGDAIQFARYVPMVAAQGARVILMVADTLVPLLSELPGVVRCIPRSINPALEFDTHCGITSLPLAFATRLETIPASVPYLPAPDPARVRIWEERLGQRQTLRVGLVWSGNPGQSDDHNRSMPLRTLLPLLELDAAFVSLQKDPRPEDRELLAQTRIIDLTAHLTDFAETAALASCLDLVMSVCTSTAHLSGALACPTWVLLPHTPDWRWLLDRDDSPWYPTARLFRQDESRDYGRVIGRVEAELRQLIASWKGKTSSLPPVGAAPPFIPDDADSLHLMGLQALQEKQFDRAVEWLSRAIRRDPRPLYLTTLGTTLLGQGRRDEALQVFDKAVQLRPDDPELWKNLGFALVEVGRPADAIQCLQQTLKLDPCDADAAYRVSLLLYQEERYEEALSTFTLSAQLQPGHFPTIYMRALAFQNLKRFDEALVDNERAHALDPNNPDACLNMANVLRALFRQQEAIAWYDRSLALRPNFASALGNKAVALAELRRFDEAIATYRAAIAADPSHAVAQWNLGLLLLLLGDFESGWAAQEARWKVGALSFGYPDISAPKWLGTEPIAGKTILACAHEGLGDAIQFVRYVPMLAARGARVILVVQDSLRELLSKVEGVAQCLPLSASVLPACDFHVPLSSLPLAFGTRLNTIPAQKSYLPAPPVERVQAWERRLGAHAKLRVGLVWSGNPRHNNDRNRSVAFRRLAPLFDLDAAFISLQKDPRPEDRSILAERGGVIDLTAALTDFFETAALIACLDLVITVDTSVAHLAAALGCPTWILLPYTPDYRWLLDREDSPWYPTALLFRQDERHDYGRVIERVRDRLNERIEAWRAGAATPGQSADLLNLGNTLKRQGRLDDAFRAFNRAVEIDIDSPAAWKALAQLLADMNRRDEAALSYQHVLKLDPDDADAAYQAGFLSLLSGRSQDALALLDRSCQLRADHAPTLQMRGSVLKILGRLAEAEADLAQAHALAPEDAGICNSMGALLCERGRQEQALTWFDKALTRRSDLTLARYNKAQTLGRLRRFDEAFAIYAALKAASPDDAEPDWNAALLHLLTGNFEAGWIGREARWKLPRLGMPKRDFAQPMWLGQEPLEGKTILIDQDEGLGDVIQFVRYVPMVAAKGARVVLLVDNALVSLLSKFPGVAECVPKSGVRQIAFDAYCGISSLPLAFETRLETIPATVPYVPTPDPMRVRAWEERLGPHDKMRVGLVWSGNPSHRDDHNRSLALRALTPLLDLDVAFVSLQIDPRSADQATLRERPEIVDLTVHLTDLAETAALMSCLDLVITVDTSMAHLAGALALPTWILLPHTPDWRWLLDRDDSPWYPTARLFRQDESRDYGRVIERVRSQLVGRIETWRADTASPTLGHEVETALPVDTKAPAALCELACRHRQAGRTLDARSCCDQALAADANCAEAMHLLGLLSLDGEQLDDAVDWFTRAVHGEEKSAYLVSLGNTLKRRGRLDDAFRALNRAVEIDVDSPVAWKALAQMLADLNRLHEAALSFQHVLKLDRRDPDAAYQAGFLFMQCGKAQDALALLDRADLLRPDHGPTLQMRALAIGSLGRLEEALALLSRAHALLPDDADICNNMGVFLQRLSRHEEALTWLDKALARRPDFTAAYHAGLLLIHVGKPEEALAYLERADQLRPDHAPVLQARAIAVGGLQRFDEAVALLARAHALAPDDAEICNGMGITLLRLDRLEEALSWFDRALARRPDLAAAFTNKGFTLGHLHRFDEALALYAALKAIDPDNVEAEWCASLLHLLIGNLEVGWAAREARWKIPEQPLARYGFSQPMWLGQQPIHGKTILIHQDEGLGDVIQFVRYVPMLVSLGARVILLVDDALVPLLSNLPGVLECLPKSDHGRARFDVHCAITSLPLAFKTTLATIPAAVPYLPAPEEARRKIWERRLGPHDRMRVGLVWSGNPTHANDRYRSIPLRDLSQLLDLDATFVSLQKDPRPADKASLREWPGIVDLTNHFTDLTETAALIACLDLVITVDTSIAHLAGALARPTWILLPHTPDWRWLLDRDDSPWYPTALLFRQDESRNYGGVIARVCRQLADRIEAWRAGQNRG